MPEFPLSYHITFGTYGTRLHGDARGTVSRDQNRYGEPIIGRDDEWRRLEEEALQFPPVFLNLEQRLYAEAAVPNVCVRGGWSLHITACQADHVHTLLSAQAPGKAVRKWLKRWLGESLSERWPTAPGQTWWAEGGSVKWVWDQEYFEAVLKYIQAQRTTDD